MPSEAHDTIAAMLREAPMFASPDGRLDVPAIRKSMEAMTAGSLLPEGTRSEALDAGGVAAEWLWGAGADASRALLYLHGGGYVIGSIRTHRALAARLAEAAGVRALIIDYRLAPEHPHPAAVDDAVAAYDFLLGRGVAPERIALGGDSAGGGLVFATLVALREAGRPLPGAAIALSPWTDLEGTGESMRTRAEVDPMVGLDGLLQMAAMYLAGADPRQPTASPLHADLRGLPPVAIQVGTAETLLDDSLRIAERLRAAGGEVELEAFDELIHVFQAFAPHVPESVEAIAKLGDFLKRRL